MELIFTVASCDMSEPAGSLPRREKAYQIALAATRLDQVHQSEQQSVIMAQPRLGSSVTSAWKV